MKFRIFGVVREKGSRRPVRGLLVRAFDKDRQFDDFLGNAVTDSSGFFSIDYEGEDFQELSDRLPDIYLNVYGSVTIRDPRHAGDDPIYTTKRHVRFNAGRQEYFDLQVARARLGPDAPGTEFIAAPMQARWKRLIDRYIKEHPLDFRYNWDKGIEVPRLECTSNFGQWNSLNIGVSATETITVTNKGNGISFSSYVEIYEGPFGFGHPLRDYRLCDYRILTVNPGQTVDVKLQFNRLLAKGSIVGVCFDPFLDPLGFHLVEQIHHDHITSKHYITPYDGAGTTFYPHDSPVIPQLSD